MNNEIDIKTLKPFTKFICTIGELPTSYIVSMSYEEQLLWLCNYLEKTVIPTLNNNSLATKELQEKFIELKEYVDSYFDNLDIQEEVDNKLDEMYENGQLQSLIEQFIDLTVTFTYGTVAELKQATNLVAGQYVKTIGFYNYNDNGGATYHVRALTSLDTIDEITIIALNEPTLVAELLITNQMNVKQFAAKGDGINDDTSNIQLALNKCNNIIINNGTYMIDAVTGIEPKNNSKIELVNATLKAIPNNQTNYHIVLINNKHDIIIEGGNIEGDKDTHLGETGEWGQCITVNGNSYNITIRNVNLIKGWGDGLYVNQGHHITADNLFIDDNSRNGISVVNGNNIVIKNCEISNTDRTNPRAAIDLEPNPTDSVSDVIIQNCNMHDNLVGIKTYCNNSTLGVDGVKNIDIINNIIKNCGEHSMDLEIGRNFNVLNNIIDTGNIGIRIIEVNYANVKGNNIKSCTGAGITFSRSNNGMIDNNNVSYIGDGFSGGIIATDSTVSSIINNIIHDCQHTGIFITGTENNKSDFLNISFNKVYNCNLERASYYDIHLKLNVEKCYISHNDLRIVDLNYTRACVVATDNPNPTNIIAYNLMEPKVATTMNTGNNITCDNIVSNNLRLGNITRA